MVCPLSTHSIFPHSSCLRLGCLPYQIEWSVLYQLIPSFAIVVVWDWDNWMVCPLSNRSSFPIVVVWDWDASPTKLNGLSSIHFILPHSSCLRVGHLPYQIEWSVNCQCTPILPVLTVMWWCDPPPPKLSGLPFVNSHPFPTPSICRMVWSHAGQCTPDIDQVCENQYHTLSISKRFPARSS